MVASGRNQQLIKVQSFGFHCRLDDPCDVRLWQILLQKSLAILLNSDSVALTRFAVEAIDDGAAQSTPTEDLGLRNPCR